MTLRGCYLLHSPPSPDWLADFYATSLPLLGQCSGPQLANLGWALAKLQSPPPRQWRAAWLAQLRRVQCGGGRPARVPARLWHGVGYAVHAERAVLAMQLFGLREDQLRQLCSSMNTPMPTWRASLYEQEEQREQKMLMHQPDAAELEGQLS